LRRICVAKPLAVEQGSLPKPSLYFFETAFKTTKAISKKMAVTEGFEPSISLFKPITV
jgi:hypothetical protein